MRTTVFPIMPLKRSFFKTYDQMEILKKNKKEAELKRALPFGISHLHSNNSLLLQQEMKTSCIYNSSWAEPRLLPALLTQDSPTAVLDSNAEMDHNPLYSDFHGNTSSRVEILLFQVRTGCEQPQKPTAPPPNPTATS